MSKEKEYLDNTEEEFIEEIVEEKKSQRNTSDFSIFDYVKFGKYQPWVEKNSKLLGIGALAIILAIGGFIYYKNTYLPKQEIKASEALAASSAYFINDSLNKAVNGDGEYDGALDIADNYGGTKAGNIAEFIVARNYIKEGNFEDAIKYLKKTDFDDLMVSKLSKILIGDCYLELEDYGNAAKYYKKGASDSKNIFASPRAMMKLALTYELTEDWDDAADVYQTIEEDYESYYTSKEVAKYHYRAISMAEKK